MKKPNLTASATASTITRKFVLCKTPIAIASLAVILTACGGGGDGGGYYGGGSYQPPPILEVGMQRQFTGSTIRTVTYTNPTTTSPNNTLAYSFTESQNVYQAAANEPGYFDINTVYSYTTTQDPGVGSVPISQVSDDYRDLIFADGGQFTVDYGQTSTVLNNDETANALGGGPYTQTTATTANYTTAREGLLYPLVTGEINNIPQSSVENINFSDLNASNAAPPNGSNTAYTKSRTENDDGSLSYQQTGATGININFTENSNGSGSNTNTNSNTSTTTATTVSVPVFASGVYSIPVTQVVTSATPSSNSYSALDWYPGGALVPTPLVNENQTVIGPVSTLPAQCNGALLLSDIFEVDTTTTNLNTVGGSYATTSTQAFNSNGVSVCTLTQETSYAYDVLTGALNSTTTTQTTTLLKTFYAP